MVTPWDGTPPFGMALMILWHVTLQVTLVTPWDMTHLGDLGDPVGSDPPGLSLVAMDAGTSLSWEGANSVGLLPL